MFRVLVAVSVSLGAMAQCCLAVESEPIRASESGGGLAYEVVGEGPHLVLIHGTNLDRRMWDREIEWLKECHRVLRYDLRGQGASVDPVEKFSNHSDLLALLDEIGETEACLIGLSAGAQVALDVALTAPDRVRCLVLVSPSLAGFVPKEMPPFFADLGGALNAGDFERANEVLLASSIMAVPVEFEDLVRTMVTDNTRLWTMSYSLIEQVSPPVIQRLDTIMTPSLILVGENDLEAVHAQGILLEEGLNSVTRTTIAGGGHLLNLTSPEAFRGAVGKFLADVSGESVQHEEH